MTWRTLFCFVALGGLCALLGYLAILSGSKGALKFFLGAYAFLLVTFLVTTCRTTPRNTSGKPYEDREKA